MAIERRDMDDVVDTLRRMKSAGRRCVLLIGAGCSVEAGIPESAAVVKWIEENHPRAYNRAKTKTYPHCMAQLTEGERRELICNAIANAKINSAHVGIASLVAHGYVDRVLTTNFDPLVIYACAMLGVFPAVYDVANSSGLNLDRVSDPSVFYLHGQHTGVRLLHTERDVAEISERVLPVIRESGRDRTWLVVGYSGECDPVFKHLADEKGFFWGLHWIVRKGGKPGLHIQQGLLEKAADAYYVNEYDADDFFSVLAQRLECFPPEFVGTPFTYLGRLLERLKPYTLPGQTTPIDSEARNMAGQAAARFERGEVTVETSVGSKDGESKQASQALLAQSLLMAGKYDEVIALHASGDDTLPTELIEPLSWAYLMQGNALADLADRCSGAESERLRNEAERKYVAALDIKPDFHEALYNLGLSLDQRARTNRGGVADQLWKQAYEKYEQALRAEPNDVDTLCNWGDALDTQAQTKDKGIADQLWKQAYEKYEQALRADPNDVDALCSWGNALDNQARTKSGEVADRLRGQAFDKYEQALSIKPDDLDTLYNCATVFLAHARTKQGDDLIRCRERAAELLSKAQDLQPGLGAYELACLAAVSQDEAQCRRWLIASAVAGKLPSRARIETDTDLDSVRGCDWFADILATATRE